MSKSVYIKKPMSPVKKAIQDTIMEMGRFHYENNGVHARRSMRGKAADAAVGGILANFNGKIVRIGTNREDHRKGTSDEIKSCIRRSVNDMSHLLVWEQVCHKFPYAGFKRMSSSEGAKVQDRIDNDFRNSIDRGGIQMLTPREGSSEDGKDPDERKITIESGNRYIPERPVTTEQELATAVNTATEEERMILEDNLCQ